MSLTSAQIVSESDLEGTLTSNLGATDLSFTATFRDKKTGVARTPQATTKLFTVNKDNESAETILLDSHSTAAGVTTCTINAAGRNIPKYGAGAGAGTGNTHYAGNSIGCVNVARPLNVIANEACSKSGDTLTGNYTITGDIGLTGDITQTGDLGITGSATISTPLAVASGGTGGATAGAARASLSAAVLGANSDITSLAGLTTPLTVAQGGMGAATHTSKAILTGNGGSAITEILVGAAGKTIVSDGSEWKAGDAPAGGAAPLLDTTQRTDTVDAAPTAGSIIYANATPKWDELVVGTAGQYLKVNSGGTNIAWDTSYSCPVYIMLHEVDVNYHFWIRSSQTLLIQDPGNFGYIHNILSTKFVEPNSGGAACFGNWTYYRDTGTDYVVGTDNGISKFKRYAANFASSADMVLTGAAPASYGAVKAYDFQNDYLLVQDNSNSTQIRRYTISGLNITNINSDITLSALPGGAAQYAMFVDANYIYLTDVNAGTTYLYVSKYDKATGTLINSAIIGYNSQYSLLGQDIDTYLMYIRPWERNLASGKNGHIYRFDF